MGKKHEDFVQVTLFILIFLNVMTFVHELGHYTALRAFGCNAYSPQVFFFFGATPFHCDTHALQPWQWWIVAYAGPLSALIVSMYLWYKFGPDSIWRLAALVGFMYGVLPNLVWQIRGTDAYFAVSMGFPPAWATFVLVSAISIIGWIVYREIADF